MFSIRLCGPEEASVFWGKNSGGTAFSAPEITETFAKSCDWWLVEKGAASFALWPVAKDDSGDPYIPEFSYYLGPVFSDIALSRPVSSQFSDNLKVYPLFIETLSRSYGEFQFELSPRLTDVRPFIWWNQEKRNEAFFRIEPKYTAELRGLKSKSPDHIISQLRPVRRRDFNKIEALGHYELVQPNSWDEITALYLELFRSKGIVPDVEKTRSLSQMKNLLGTPWSIALGAREKTSGDLVSAVFIIRGKGISNMVLVASSSSHRATGVQTWLIVKAILEAKKLGDDVFDFNGANSPKGGDDKHSYGASPVLYFRVMYGQSSN